MAQKTDPDRTTYVRTGTPPAHRDAPRTTVRPQPTTQKTGK